MRRRIIIIFLFLLFSLNINLSFVKESQTHTFSYTHDPDRPNETFNKKLNEKIENKKVKNGDIIEIESGKYSINLPILITNKSITLKSKDGQKKQVKLSLNGDLGSISSMINIDLSGEDRNLVVIKGLTIVGASKVDAIGRGRSRGISIQTGEQDEVHVEDNAIVDHVQDIDCGGAIKVIAQGSSNKIFIERNDIIHNAGYHGGGIGIQAPGGANQIHIIGNTISRNRARSQNGGGLYVSILGSVNQIRIFKNIINGNKAKNEGGGIYAGIFNFSNRENPRNGIFISENTIHDNKAFKGAGVFIANTSEVKQAEMVNKVEMTQNLITDCGKGGGVFVDSNKGEFILAFNGFFNNLANVGATEKNSVDYYYDGWQTIEEIDENIHCDPDYIDPYYKGEDHKVDLHPSKDSTRPCKIAEVALGALELQ